MSPTPHVTVLIPTYNQAEFVRETLDSVLAQDHGSFDVVVSDDGSSDGTQDVLAEYDQRDDPRLRVVLNNRNRGIAANFSTLLDAATGEYYAWLGGDDVMLPGKLSRQVERLARHPDAAGAVHDAEVFSADTVNGRFSEMYNGRRGFREGGAELWLRPWYYTLPSTMMIRTAARAAGGYDSRLRYANEWLFDIETFRNGRCLALDDVLVRYRRHPGSVTHSTDHAQRVLEENFVVLGIVEARYPEYARLVALRRTSLLFLQGVAARRQGDHAAGNTALRAALAEGGPVGLARVAASFAAIGIRRRVRRIPAPV